MNGCLLTWQIRRACLLCTIYVQVSKYMWEREKGKLVQFLGNSNLTWIGSRHGPEPQPVTLLHTPKELRIGLLVQAQLMRCVMVHHRGDCFRYTKSLKITVVNGQNDFGVSGVTPAWYNDSSEIIEIDEMWDDEINQDQATLRQEREKERGNYYLQSNGSLSQPWSLVLHVALILFIGSWFLSSWRRTAHFAGQLSILWRLEWWDFTLHHPLCAWVRTSSFGSEERPSASGLVTPLENKPILFPITSLEAEMWKRMMLFFVYVIDDEIMIVGSSRSNNSGTKGRPYVW